MAIAAQVPLDGGTDGGVEEELERQRITVRLAVHEFNADNVSVACNHNISLTARESQHSLIRVSFHHKSAFPFSLALSLTLCLNVFL